MSHLSPLPLSLTFVFAKNYCCALNGNPLTHITGHYNAMSMDEIVVGRGYVLGNVWLIGRCAIMRQHPDEDGGRVQVSPGDWNEAYAACITAATTGHVFPATDRATIERIRLDPSCDEHKVLKAIWSSTVSNDNRPKHSDWTEVSWTLDEFFDALAQQVCSLPSLFSPSPPCSVSFVGSLLALLQAETLPHGPRPHPPLRRPYEVWRKAQRAHLRLR